MFGLAASRRQFPGISHPCPFPGAAPDQVVVAEIRGHRAVWFTYDQEISMGPKTTCQMSLCQVSRLSARPGILRASGDQRTQAVAGGFATRG